MAKSDYIILRPPLVATFELPTQNDLLKLKVGDSAKLIFQVGDDSPERMWVRLTDCSKQDAWKGIIDTDATQEATLRALPASREVIFHPLDIIQTLD